jgi:SAM-dependent methyltransferase
MSKQGEIDYLARLGPEGASHARGKPFTDPARGELLADIGGILMVIPPPPARVLDLGCGSGWTSLFLARCGYDVVGQDIAPDMVALGEGQRAQAGLANLRFVVSDYESLDFRDEFDVAIFYDALHHALAPQAAIECCWRALKPGGVLVTVEPGVGHARSAGTRSVVATYGITERDMPPRLVIELGRKAGFREATVHPMPKIVAALQFGPPVPRACPSWLAPFARWLATGWVTLAGRRRYGGMVVLRK